MATVTASFPTLKAFSVAAGKFQIEVKAAAPVEPPAPALPVAPK